MIKLLILQQWYGLSDPQFEREAYDRLSFRHFLGYPEKIPDNSTIWLFRERLATSGKDEIIWNEIQRQIDQKGLTIRRGMIQDASFITSDPGHAPSDTLEENRHRPGGVVMVPGQRRARNHISDTNSISSSTRIIKSSDASIPPRPLYMIAGLISLKQERPFIETRDIMG